MSFGQTSPWNKIAPIGGRNEGDGAGKSIDQSMAKDPCLARSAHSRIVFCPSREITFIGRLALSSGSLGAQNNDSQ